MEFDEFFDNSNLPDMLKRAKTLSKKECNGIFDYMRDKKDIILLEFGTQYGCSTAVFLQIAKHLEININLHSWDVMDIVKKDIVDKRDFSLHIENITGREKFIFNEYKPNLVFLDAHPYDLTKNIVSICLERKIDFMCHDVSPEIYERTKRQTDNFINKSIKTKAAWELLILMELISESLLTSNGFTNDKIRVNCIRDKYGLAIIENK